MFHLFMLQNITLSVQRCVIFVYVAFNCVKICFALPA